MSMMRWWVATEWERLLDWREVRHEHQFDALVQNLDRERNAMPSAALARHSVR